MTSPPIVITGGLPNCRLGVTSEEVVPSTMINEAKGASDNVVPETVIAGPPGMRDWSPTTNDGPDGAEIGAKTSLPTLIVSAAGSGITDVTPSTTRKDAEDANDSVVPDAVIAEPPGTSV
jgi:hypothetical protein